VATSFLGGGVAGENALERGRRHKIFGVQVAIVTDNKDTTGLYRVRVRYPWLSNGGESGGEASFWARIATFGAGKERGTYWLPENGDEVLVSFLDGDVENPFVVGSLWNKDSNVHRDNNGGTPKYGYSPRDPATPTQSAGKNNIRSIVSRSGHYIEFNDDAEGKKEAITIQTKKGAIFQLDDSNGAVKAMMKTSDNQNQITMDETNKKITMQTDSGDILIKAKEKVRIEAKVIETSSDKETKMEAGTTWTTTAKKDFTLESTSAAGNVKSSQTMTIKGSQVNIN
jgi:uncharacterized protein involved in type VI secretion and phage assembly